MICANPLVYYEWLDKGGQGLEVSLFSSFLLPAQRTSCLGVGWAFAEGVKEPAEWSMAQAAKQERPVGWGRNVPPVTPRGTSSGAPACLKGIRILEQVHQRGSAMSGAEHRRVRRGREKPQGWCCLQLLNGTVRRRSHQPLPGEDRTRGRELQVCSVEFTFELYSDVNAVPGSTWCGRARLFQSSSSQEFVRLTHELHCWSCCTQTNGYNLTSPHL